MAPIGVQTGRPPAVEAEGEKIGQGAEQAREFLTENPDLLAQLEARVRALAGLSAGSAEAAEPAQPVQH